MRKVRTETWTPRGRVILASGAFWLLLASGASGAPVSPSQPGAPVSLADRLAKMRRDVLRLESELLQGEGELPDAGGGSGSQAGMQYRMRKIRQLLKIQREERALGQQRMQELQSTLTELENRRKELEHRILAERISIRRTLGALERSASGISARSSGGSDPGIAGAPGASRSAHFEDHAAELIHLPERERLEAPRRKVLASLAARSLREIEAIKVDLHDADQLEHTIQEERYQLAYLLQDLNEQEGVLRLNEQLQSDLLRKQHQEKLLRLKDYHRLKSAEAQVEEMISDFNSRKELEHAVEAERQATRAMKNSLFAGARGKLPFPLEGGKILSSFGKYFDPKTRLYIFRKGITIGAAAGDKVKAVSPGKIAFSGELPGYGRVAIVDHGDHFYSLCGQLGNLVRKKGDAVAAGDVIGSADAAGTPVYFEIRARNIPVNPLQWVAN